MLAIVLAMHFAMAMPTCWPDTWIIMSFFFNLPLRVFLTTRAPSVFFHTLFLAGPGSLPLGHLPNADGVWLPILDLWLFPPLPTLFSLRCFLSLLHCVSCMSFWGTDLYSFCMPCCECVRQIGCPYFLLYRLRDVVEKSSYFMENMHVYV